MAERSSLVAAWKATETIPAADQRADVAELRERIGALALQAGEARVAEAALEQALVFRQQHLPDEDPALQSIRLRLARAKHETGELPEARTLLRKVLSVRTRTLPADHDDVVNVLLDLGSTEHELGNDKAALALFEKAWQARVRRLPEDDLAMLRIRQNIGVARLSLGEWQRARDIFEPVHTVLAAKVPEDDPQLLATRGALASCRAYLGDLRGAQDLQQKVLEVHSRTLPADHPSLVRIQGDLATTRYALGDLRAALELHRTVVGSLSRTLPADNLDLLMRRSNLAVTLQALGDLREAREELEAVHAAMPGKVSEEHPHLQRVRENLAAVRAALGDLRGSVALNGQILEVLGRTLPEDHLQLQQVRRNVAIARIELGDLQGARTLIEHIVEICSSALPEDHMERQEGLMLLARVKSAQGDEAGAVAILGEVVRRLSGRVAPDHPTLQMARANLAASLLGLGELERAATLTSEAYAIATRDLAEDHPERLRLTILLAEMKGRAGDLTEALVLSRRALEVRTRALPADHPDLQHAREMHATLLLQAGDAGGARSLLEQAIEDASRRVAFVATSLSPRAYEEANRGMERLVSRLLSCADPAMDPALCAAGELAILLRFRGLVDRQVRRGEVLRQAARTDDRLNGLLAAAREAQVHLQAAANSGDQRLRATVPAKIQVLEAAQEALWDGANRLPGMTALGDPPALREVAGRLPRDGIAVVVASYLRCRPAPRGRLATVDPAVAAYLVDRSGRISRHELGTQESLAGLCGRLVQGLEHAAGSRSESLAGPTSRPDPQAAAAEIGSRLAPVLAAIPEGTRSLLVSPDGELASIPWEVVPWRGKTLRDHLEVRYVETLAALAERPGIDGNPGLLVLGGADYGAEPVGEVRDLPHLPLLRDGRSFAFLPGSLREAEAVRDLFVRAWPLGDQRLLAGREAAKGPFVRLAPAYRFLHVATHAYVPEGDVRYESNVVSTLASAGATLERDRGLPRGLRTGIVFAGANRVVQQGPDDALLTALELEVLDLSRCELAVLSACQTSVGPRAFGDAVTGLNRALRLAGAHHTITSLWKVRDDGASAFFTAFYRALWEDKLPIHKAMARAQATVMEAGFGPGVWAAFVLYGAGAS